MRTVLEKHVKRKDLIGSEREPTSKDIQESLLNGEAGNGSAGWPSRPELFSELLTPVEAAQYLRLDETGTHTPQSAIRTLNYWRQKDQLKATKFARHVWYRKSELDRFLAVKTEM